jgi:5-methyltetrahydropteroyltriglutamate--homocysteine methyltransferase
MAGETSKVRAENVGSFLQPDSILEGRKRLQEGAITAAELSEIEDREIRNVISLQESAGLEVVTDGEFRRPGWADTVRYANGIEPREGARSYPANVRVAATGGLNFGGGGGFPTVVGKITPKAEPVGYEYPFLAANATARTKYTMAAPSYHRRYWSDTLSPGESGYASCEEYLKDVRDWLHDVAVRLASEGCTYIQLDAPNYGSLCDPDTRAWHESVGHDVDKEIAFDAALDSSVFEGLPANVTRALHICRGNQPGGTWHSSGGYGALADAMFPNLEMDTLLLEYDSDRAGDFAPLAKIKPGQIAVLGLLTTKEAPLESRASIEARIEEAAGIKPLAELALSTQCGFASAQNAPMTVDEEIAKLTLVSGVAHSIWG